MGTRLANLSLFRGGVQYLFLIVAAMFGFADAPFLRGVVLIPDEAELLAPEMVAAMEGIHTERIAPPGKRAELEALLEPFCNAINADSISTSNTYIIEGMAIAITVWICYHTLFQKRMQFLCV